MMRIDWSQSGFANGFSVAGRKSKYFILLILMVIFEWPGLGVPLDRYLLKIWNQDCSITGRGTQQLGRIPPTTAHEQKP
jgi:hypothetical protein